MSTAIATPGNSPAAVDKNEDTQQKPVGNMPATIPSMYHMPATILSMYFLCIYEAAHAHIH